MSFANVNTSTVNNVPFPGHLAYAGINSVPAGAAWQATNGPIPYGDAALGYDGPVVNIGDSVTYSPVTHKFTVGRRGMYQVLAIQNIDVANAIGPVFSNGRIVLRDSLGANVGIDSGRVETTLGIATAGVLSYDLSMINISLLERGEYTVEATAENGGPGLLLGKGGVTFSLLSLAD